MPTQVSLLDGALASAGTLAIQTNGTTSAITISSAQVATFVNNPIMTGLTASRAVFTDGSKGLTSNAITGTGNVVMSASPTMTGTIDGAALTLSSSLTLSGGTANGVLYLNGSKVATSGSALTFDGSNLGIGTASPSYPLHIVKNSAGAQKVWFSNNSTNSAAETAFSVSNGTAEGSLRVAGTSYGGYGAYTANNTLIYNDTSAITIMADNATNGVIKFAAQSNSEGMRLTSTGLGIGTSSPAYKLDVNGVIHNNAAVFVSQGIQGNSSGFTFSGAGSNYGRIYEAANDRWALGYSASYGGASTEVLNWNSSGNLGLGVTPSAWGSGTRGFNIGSGSAIWNPGSGNQTHILTNAYNDGTNYIYRNSSNASRYSMVGDAHQWHIAPSGTAGNAITFTQAMTLDASGNLGIGTTSPTWMVSVRKDSASGGSGAYPVVQINNANASGYAALYLNDSTAQAGLETRRDTAHLGMYAGGSERARIDSSGNLLVGATSSSGTPRLHIKGSSTSASELNFFFVNSAGSTVLAAYNDGALYADNMKSGAGTNAVKFSTSTGQITYDTSSARYKDNIRDSIYGLSHVMQMRSAQFEYKDDGRSDVGLIAEELDPIIPELVGKNKEDQPDSVSYDRMVSVLVKAIQEQQAIIESLKARLDAANL